MARNIKKQVKKNKEISYLSKDFESFRSELVNYAKNHYGNKIIDFTESSVAGMFFDIASYVGDSLSFYLDHQFNELNLETAVEPKNIEALARQAGVKISGATPATVFAVVRFIIPATVFAGVRVVNKSFLPKVLDNSVFTTEEGVNFYSAETVDFGEVDVQGNLKATVTPNSITNGQIQDFVVEREIFCTSARFVSENFIIDNKRTPFRVITLNNLNVHEIISVKDSANDEYFEVDTLTQDTVFAKIENSRMDRDLVPNRLKLIPAPKRFITVSSLRTGKTLLRFGAGDEDTFDEDAIPDPSEHAVTLFGDKKTFKKIAIDPNSFLSANTLGVSPRNTTITVKYSYGGGINHNIDAGELALISALRTEFSSAVPASTIASIRRSAIATNDFSAFGGENEPSIEQIRNIALLSKTSQNRVVTREDLLARIYNMPTNFGRVFRAAVRDNPNNPFATQLHVISRDKDGVLIITPDTLKENLSIFLSKFRLVSDAIDVVDASIVNLSIKYLVTIERGLNKTSILQGINSTLKIYFDIKNYHIDQPIIMGEVENLILNSQGVVSIISLKFNNVFGVEDSRVYSTQRYSPARNTDRGMLFPPDGGIFEIRYPGDDIQGGVV